MTYLTQLGLPLLRKVADTQCYRNITSHYYPFPHSSVKCNTGMGWEETCSPLGIHQEVGYIDLKTRMPTLHNQHLNISIGLQGIKNGINGRQNLLA